MYVHAFVVIVYEVKVKFVVKYMHSSACALCILTWLLGTVHAVRALGHKIDKVVIGCYMKGHLERELFVIMILTCELV